FIMQSSASSHVGRVARTARSSATGLYVSLYYLGGASGASLLVIPWKFGGWKALVSAMLLVQFVSFVLVRRFFIHKRRNTGGIQGIVLD
ncbi:MAG TPA: hypothetical protein VF857_04725, partial [Spirochaetota bacterium]